MLAAFSDFISVCNVSSVNDGTPHASVIAAFEFAMQSDGEINRYVVNATMTAAYGGTDAAGAWTPRMAYNRLEAALARHLIVTSALARATITDLAALLHRTMVNQSRRTLDMAELQQFSTPPTIGLLAARAADLAADDIVLEPSAGCGLLVAFAAAAGVRVVVNELDDDRRLMLGALPLRLAAPILAIDAKFLRAGYGLQPGLPRPSVVLMNPPFSRDGNSNRHLPTSVGMHHVEEAFGLLRPGGRLVAILGAYTDPTARPEQFAKLLSEGVLRASIAIDGSAYAPMGTTMGVRIIVIDKLVPTDAPRVEPVIRSGSLSLAEATLAVAAIPRRTELVHGPEHIAPTQLVPVVAAANGKPRNARATYGGRLADDEMCEPVTYSIVESQRDDQDTDTFSVYEPKRVRFYDAKPHPHTVVESISLHAVSPPLPRVQIFLPRRLITEGRLSDIQLEAVLYAAQAHEQHIQISLPDETGDHAVRTYRRGFLIGDGGGIGKGREVCAIIRNAIAKGCKRVLWVSETEALLEDAQRDWTALGGRAEEVIAVNRWPVHCIIPIAEGILFCTYATLRSESKKHNRSRLDQIVEFLGPNSDSVVIFDESHNGGNAASIKSEFGTTSASLQGLAMLDLQRRIPDARVVYTSATAAAEPNNLSYAERLGLWGVGTAFATRLAFIAEMETAGIGALEIVCRDMVSGGMYCARTLSAADVTYERVTHDLTPAQLDAYAAFNTAWRLIANSAEASLDTAGADGRARGAARSQLYSTMQRFYAAILVAFKLPAAIDIAQQALADGCAVVFQLTSTNEAVQERALAARDLTTEDLEELDLSPRELIFDYLVRAYPTTQYEEYTDAAGEVRTRPLMVNDAIVQNPDAIAAREALMGEIATLMCPDGPLETLLSVFGPDNLAEITGRKRRMVYRTVNGERVRTVEDRPAGSNIAETNAFMDDEKRVLIFSAAGGTGRSYDADRSRKNTRKRIHIPLQFGWRIETAMQGLFRTLRANQMQAPHYVLVTTNVPAEKRFVMSIVREFEAIGAMTRGQRDAAGTDLFNAGDNLETSYAIDAMDSLFRAIEKNEVEGCTLATFATQTGLGQYKDGCLAGIKSGTTIQRFLNRLLAVDIDANGGLQKLLIDQLYDRIADLVAQAHAMGTLDEGVRRLRSRSLRIISRQELASDPQSGATTTFLKMERTDPAVANSYEDAAARVHRYLRYHPSNRHAGFYETPELGVHAVVPLLASQNERRKYPEPRGYIVTPFGEKIETLYRYSNAPVTTNNPRNDGEWIVRTIGAQRGAVAWAKAAKSAADKTTTFCGVVGNMLSVWSKLPKTYCEVFRATTDDGERLLLRKIDPTQVYTTLSHFGKTPDAMTYIDAIALAKLGHPRVLENGWMLKRARLNSTMRVEVVVPNIFAVRRLLEAAGVIIEQIGYAWRAFLPVDAEAEVLAAVVPANCSAVAAATA